MSGPIVPDNPVKDGLSQLDKTSKDSEFTPPDDTWLSHSGPPACF